MLGMTENTAYGATHHIRAVAIVPGPDEAGEKDLKFFHKSFPDYLQDFKRSGFSPDFDSEVQRLMCQCALRIFEEAPDGVYMDGTSNYDLELFGGVLKNGPGTGDNISVSWPVVGEYDNRKLRFNMFKEAIWRITDGLRWKKEAFQSLLCMRVLTTCFATLDNTFPFVPLTEFVFVSCIKFDPAYVTELVCKDESRRRELLDHGILKQVPLETLDYDKTSIDELRTMRFRSPTIGLSDPWNTSCKVSLMVVDHHNSVIICLPSTKGKEVGKVIARTGQRCSYSCLKTSHNAITASNDSSSSIVRNCRVDLSRFATSPL
jgi:hypothetical protein